MISLDDTLPGHEQGEINLTVQGKNICYQGRADVRSLLESQGEKTAYLNVRINGEVRQNRDFENMAIKDGDTIDFLYYMGGGCVQAN